MEMCCACGGGNREGDDGGDEGGEESGDEGAEESGEEGGDEGEEEGEGESEPIGLDCEAYCDCEFEEMECWEMCHGCLDEHFGSDEEEM